VEFLPDSGHAVPDESKDTMSRRGRRNHTPTFKAKVALAAIRGLNGSGVWRSPKSRGVATNPYEALFVAKDEPMRRWRSRTLELLKRHLEPDRGSRAREDAPHEYVLPVLSPRDRRAFVRSLWMPFIPEAAWSATVPKRAAVANVYLDVSGSMDMEMPQIIALLGRLSRYIRRPFWAFSNCVAPAVIRNGQLVASTTGGTSMACVLRHVAETGPRMVKKLA